jgi:antitoxin PrlF
MPYFLTNGDDVVATTAVSKLTSKSQTTIPASVRERLDLAPGDRLVFDLSEGGAVVLRKWTPVDPEWTQAVESTLDEWASEEDEEAYREL